MAGRFEALDELLDDSLTLPMRGRDGTQREYRIPSPDAETGMRVERLMTTAAQVMATGEAPENTEMLDDAQELDLYRAALSDQVYDQAYVELDWVRFRHLAMTAVIWVTAGTEEAERYWKAGGDPSRAAPNRAERRAQARTGSSAAAKSTRSRGSTSGTKAQPRKRAAAGG